MSEPLLTRFLQPLLAGRRADCLALVRDALERGTPAETLVRDVVLPAMKQVDRLYRDDRINAAVENMAVRINRTIADQLQAHLPRAPATGKRAVVLSAEPLQEEVGAQIVADLLGARGWEVFFLGGGVPRDEVLALIGQLRPQLLLIFGTQPQAVPEVRGLMELIRDVGVCPAMNIVVSGGVFSRADRLWQEIGADHYAQDANELLEIVADLTPRDPGVVRRGFVKKRRRRRRAATTTATR